MKKYSYDRSIWFWFRWSDRRSLKLLEITHYREKRQLVQWNVRRYDYHLLPYKEKIVEVNWLWKFRQISRLVISELRMNHCHLTGTYQVRNCRHLIPTQLLYTRLLQLFCNVYSYQHQHVNTLWEIPRNSVTQRVCSPSCICKQAIPGILVFEVNKFKGQQLFLFIIFIFDSRRCARIKNKFNAFDVLRPLHLNLTINENRAPLIENFNFKMIINLHAKVSDEESIFFANIGFQTKIKSTNHFKISKIYKITLFIHRPVPISSLARDNHPYATIKFN